MSVQSESARGEEVIHLLGALERSVDEVDRHLAAGQTDLALDFSAVTFISVEGLEWLEELLLRAQSQARSVRCTNVPPSIYKVFKVARIDSILKACGSLPPIGSVC